METTEFTDAERVRLMEKLEASAASARRMTPEQARERLAAEESLPFPPKD